MSYSPCAEAEFLAENAVSEVSLLYCEPTGTPTISPVSADCLPDVLAGGITYNCSEELLLLPDSDTFTLLPAEDGISAFYCCSLCTRDGEPAPLDSRSILRKTLRRAANLGISLSVITELNASSNESSHVFSEQEPLDTADQLFSILALDHSGSSCFLRLTLTLRNEEGTAVSSDLSDRFTAGLLALIAETAAVLFPCDEAYLRLGTPEAPQYITHSVRDKSHLICRPTGSSNIILCFPAPPANPYLALAALIEAGLNGISRQLPLPAAVDLPVTSLPQSEIKFLRTFPASRMDALFAARYSGFLRKLFGAELLNRYVSELGLAAPYPPKPEGIKKRYFSVP